MEIVCLGNVTKLHGIAGQIKVRTEFDKDFDLSLISSVFSDDKTEYKVNRIFRSNGGIVISLENVNLEKAKSFVGKNIFIDRKLVEQKILFEDLKGSDVFFENGENIGKIYDIQDYGGAEVFFMKDSKGREVLFPNVKGLVVNFDYKTSKLVVNEARFREITDEYVENV